jgi:hypothetical protein
MIVSSRGVSKGSNLMLPSHNSVIIFSASSRKFLSQTTDV